MQFIDARDLAGWTLRATTDGVSGTFNATGPDYALTFGTLLEICRETLNPRAELVWMADDFLLERGLSAADLMLWHPIEAMPGWEGFFSIGVGKAVSQELSFRPLAETIHDTFAWDQTRGGEPLKVGLTVEREAALQRDWQETQAK